MKTHFPRSFLVLLAGTSLTFAQTRVIPSDPGANSGNSGAAGAGASNANQPIPGAPIGATTGTDSTGTGISTHGTRADTDAESLDRSVRGFLQTTSRLNQRELALSRLAAERATSPEVRAYATEMVREHTAAGEELTRLVSGRVAPPALKDLTTEKPIDEKDWAAKKGKDFDEDYLEAMIDAHQDNIATLETGSESKDPQVAAFSAKMLPKMKAHLAHAKALHKSIT